MNKRQFSNITSNKKGEKKMFNMNRLSIWSKKPRMISLFPTRVYYVFANAILAFIIAFAGLATGPQTVKAHADIERFGILLWIFKVDATGSFGESADFYSRIKIEDQYHKTSTIDDNNHINPNWKYEIGNTTGQLIGQHVPVTIVVWDDDGWFSSDDHVDVNPAGDRKDLNLTVQFVDPDSPDFGGFLYDRDTGEQLGVFRPISSVFGQNGSWESMPLTNSLRGQANYRARLVSNGDRGDERARIEYKVIILREPDFRITGVTLAGGRLNVSVVNDGGPGVLTNVQCYGYGLKVRRVSRTVSFNMAPGASTVVDVGLIPTNDTTCVVAGRNWFGGPEPHTDNNLGHWLSSGRNVWLHVDRLRAISSDSCNGRMDFYGQLRLEQGASAIRYFGVHEGNDIRPGWWVSAPVASTVTTVDAYIKIQDEDDFFCGGGDDNVDVNPESGHTAIKVRVNLVSNEIQLFNNAGVPGQVIGLVGQPLTLRGYHGDETGEITFRIEVG